jgi:hypothetical protein
MKNQPLRITLTNHLTQKRRTIHLVTKKKEKSYMFASKNCKNWVKKNGFPFTIYVFYGFSSDSLGKLREDFNDMVCNNYEDFEIALLGFVKERYE